MANDPLGSAFFNSLLVHRLSRTVQQKDGHRFDIRALSLNPPIVPVH